MAPPAPSTTRSTPQRPRAPFAPRDIIRGPDGTLSVAGIVAPDDVSGGKIEEYRYDGEAGTAAFKPEIDDPGGLPSDLGGPHPQGLVFGPDGNSLRLGAGHLRPVRRRNSAVQSQRRGLPKADKLTSVDLSRPPSGRRWVVGINFVGKHQTPAVLDT